MYAYCITLVGSWLSAVERSSTLFISCLLTAVHTLSLNSLCIESLHWECVESAANIASNKSSLSNSLVCVSQTNWWLENITHDGRIVIIEKADNVFVTQSWHGNICSYYVEQRDVTIIFISRAMRFEEQEGSHFITLQRAHQWRSTSQYSLTCWDVHGFNFSASSSL